MKDVLQRFIDYMEDKEGTLDALGANCYNTGWNDIDNPDVYYMGQTVADVIRCKLMTGALFFANGYNIEGSTIQGTSKTMDEAEERLRCEIANAFGYILEHKYCEHKTKWRRGIKYAWKTVQGMGEGSTRGDGIEGPVIQGTCTECGYGTKGATVRVVNGEMAEWLLREGRLMDQIGHMQGSAPCAMEWKRYIARKGVTDTVNDISKKLPEVKQTEEKVRTQTKKAFEEVTKIVYQKIKEKQDEERAGKDKNNKNTKNTHNPNTFSTTTPSKPGAGPELGDTAGGKSLPPSQPGSQPQAPASPVLPARPPGGAELGRKGDANAKGDTESQGPTPPDSALPPAAGSGQDPQEPGPGKWAVPGSSGGTSIVVAGTYDSRAPPKEILHKYGKDENPSSTKDPSDKTDDKPKSPDQQESKSPSSEQTPRRPPPEPEPTTSTSSGPEGGSAVPPDPAGQPAAPEKDGKAHGADAPVDGSGNDDPPPLNPPKPKPNTNPDQAGSRGKSGEDGDPGTKAADPDEFSVTTSLWGIGGPTSGSGGGSGTSDPPSSFLGAPGSNKNDSRKNAPDTSLPGRGNAGGSYGPNAAPINPFTPSNAHDEILSRPKHSGPTPPDLTGAVLPKPFDPKDLIPYTPAIIPAVVGIGLIALFLWKEL
ncbi:hypothetical protein AK88_00942 [Plasmodium fragile]|uniref:Schizont-infected cell agglutination extracellular alpha domain-containing protein n=1 Tax=Plasmodium fragile TaxID=5857 RepID=A0A0D9QR66_PLAFR|nr:uncharacterized protein AK88_00942 [Plasmodium fragile]KJP89282.1 hypothetical protein AK88_00942 [Plasmodium fragile]